jgi:hypothetical protein
MSIESQTMKCDYPGCGAKIEVHGYGTSWRHDYGWGECVYGDCCREHQAATESYKRLLDRVRDLVEDLDVRDRETLVAILNVLGGGAVIDKARELRWRAESGPILLRIIHLDDKTQDCGLTGEERAELGRLNEEWSRLLSEFIRDTSGKNP